MTVIGKLKDLRNLRPVERSLLDILPDRGSPKANWHQKSGVIRAVMGYRLPIRDTSVGQGGIRRDNAGFPGAERTLLDCHGWTYDSLTIMWLPPVVP